MGVDINQYPELKLYLDDSETYQNTAEPVSSGGQDFLLVSQVVINTSRQLLFSIDATGRLTFLRADTAIDPTVEDAIRYAPAHGSYLAASGQDHEIVSVVMTEQVSHFKSDAGPGKGNLACVWTVIRIVNLALNRWIAPEHTVGVLNWR
jgi:hypothetical protein